MIQMHPLLFVDDQPKPAMAAAERDKAPSKVLPHDSPELNRGSSDSSSFLRRRVGLFGLVGFAVGFLFWVLRLVVILATANWQRLLHPSLALHLAGSGAWLGIWVVVRSPRWEPSSSAIRRVESMGLLLSAGALLRAIENELQDPWTQEAAQTWWNQHQPTRSRTGRPLWGVPPP